MIEKGKPADIQDIFNCAWEQAKKKQRSYSMNDNKHICAYRGEEGAKCFIGAAIKDEDYDPDFENRIGTVVIEKITGFKCNETLGRVICKIQDVHDTVQHGLWLVELTRIASEHNLTIPGE